MIVCIPSVCSASVIHILSLSLLSLSALSAYPINWLLFIQTTQDLQLQLKELTQLLQQRSEELRTLQAEQQRLKSGQAPVDSTPSLSPTASTPLSIQELQRKLGLRDDELAQVRAKNEELLHNADKLESELVYHRKRYDVLAEKCAAEKEKEIAELTTRFNEAAEKRKEQFMQLKDKLKQASTLLQQFQSQHVAQEEKVLAAQAALTQAQQQIQSLQQQLEAAETEKRALQSSLTTQQSELQTHKQSSANQLDAIQAEMNIYRARLQSDAESIEMQGSKEVFLYVEGNEGAENARPIHLHHNLSSSLLSSIQIQWSRSFIGNDYRRIEGILAQGISYVPTVDDIGATLQIELTLPSRATSKPITREFGPIYASRPMISTILDIIKKQEVAFNVESVGEAGRNDKEKKQIALNKEKIKLRYAMYIYG